jgi:hypothetical protein
MVTIRTWLETHIWPWKLIAILHKTIATLRDERDDARKVLYENKLSYDEGYNHHWNNWIANANTFYGSRIFDDNERRAMRRFYDEGKNSFEAIEMLKKYQGVGKYAHPFSKNRY